MLVIGGVRAGNIVPGARGVGRAVDEEEGIAGFGAGELESSPDLRVFTVWMRIPGGMRVGWAKLVRPER